jgi:hypothetical protein
MKAKYLPLFLIVYVLVFAACRAGKKNCDCPTFNTKKPRRRSENVLPPHSSISKEYLIYGIASRLS